MFPWSTTTVLSLSYNRDSIKLAPQNAYRKKIVCEFLLQHEIHNHAKLIQFLHLQKWQFYPVTIKTNSAVDDCINFVKEYKKEGYQVFISILEYDLTYNNEMNGNHYIIACKEHFEIESQLKKIRKNVAVYKQESRPCVVLKNYRDRSMDKLEIIYSDVLGVQLRDPILLGKHIQTNNNISEEEFSHQMQNICLADQAKILLQKLRLRLALPLEYELVIDGRASKAVDDALTMLSHYFEQLKSSVNILDCKDYMENINHQLILFVSNFYYYLQSVANGGAVVANPDNIYTILQNISILLNVQSYQNINGVFCVLYDKASGACPKPIVYVNQFNFELLLAIFKPKGYTNLKFRMTREQEDNDWFIEMTGVPGKQRVSFARFNVVQRLHCDGEGYMAYSTTCERDRNNKYTWICIECQTVVRVNSQAKIFCACGIIAPTPDLLCLKCALENGSVQTPVSEREIAESTAEVNFACQKSEEHEIFNATATAKTIKKEKQVYTIVNASARFTKNPESKNCMQQFSLSERYAVSVKIIAPKPRTYTVLVIGSSGAGKSTLLNSIYCMQQHETLEHAVQDKIQCLLPVTLEETGEVFDGIHENNVNEHYAGVGQSVTQHPKDYVLDYGAFKIRLVDTPGITDTRGFDQDAENIKYIQEHLLKLKEVHAVMFVIKNSEVKLSAEFENTMLALFGILPRTAIHNCFFVYTFAAPDFQPGAARTPLTALLAKFSKQHNVELSLDTSNEYCVDNGILRQLLHCQKSGDRFAISSYTDYWNANCNSISRMFQDVAKVKPVLREDFKLAAKMIELGDALRKYCKVVKGELTSDAKRIMASVANGSLHGISIYCRNNSKHEKPIEDDEWATVKELWKNIGEDIGEDISNKARDIDDVIKELRLNQRKIVSVMGDKDIGVIDVHEFVPTYATNTSFQLNHEVDAQIMQPPVTILGTAREENNDTRDCSNLPHQEVDGRDPSDIPIPITTYNENADIGAYRVSPCDEINAVDAFEQVPTDPVVAANLEYGSYANSYAEDMQSQPGNSTPQSSLCRTAPLVTILVIGQVADDNISITNNIYYGKQKELVQSAKTSTSTTSLGEMTENGCIIDYGSCVVHFISLVPPNDGSPIVWNAYPEVHGFIFVIQDNSLHLSGETNTFLRQSLGIVPRSRVKNCCIVNIITPTRTLSMTGATKALSQFTTAFRGQHLLDHEINHFCVDRGLINRHEYTTRQYVDTLDTVKANVDVFILTVAETPVTFNELKLTECLTRLGDVLYRKLTFTSESKRLMTSVSSKVMSDAALRIRKFYNQAKVLSDNEWQAAVDWNLDEQVLQIVREINEYINSGMVSEQGTVSTSTKL